MLKKYIPFLFCVCLLLILILTSFSVSNVKHYNSYPNLPAPIGEEKILITSGGQAAEGFILQSIADNLHLKFDYRPRALGTDLYDYQSVVIVLGYSASGMTYTDRSFQEELIRIEELVEEAKASNMPIILANLSGAYREDSKTLKLFEETITYADYYIGIQPKGHMEPYSEQLKTYRIPATIVKQLDDIYTPFNSVFR